MVPELDFHSLGPVPVGYVAALRGVKPRGTTEPFVWASLACGPNGEHLTCLAASNPNGTFFGLMASEAEARAAQALAATRAVTNIRFLTKADELPALDFLACDERMSPLDEDKRVVFCALAERALKPGGACLWAYRAYDTPDDSLRFLVAELSPSMTPDQAREFLTELKALGPTYFKDHPFAATALDSALASGVPDEFFSNCLNGPAPRSGTFAAMEALASRGFAFAGDARVAANYMELSTPATAHDVLEACRDHVLFEPIKDFAMQRMVRADIWIRLPVAQTDDPASLFGGYVFGLTRALDSLPSSIMAGDKRLDLSESPFAPILGILGLLPASIGDLLSHPDCAGLSADAILSALQTLVACGLAMPMRSGFNGSVAPGIQTPHWAVLYNRFLDDTAITAPRVALASTIVGVPVTVSAREALVLQAVSRAGLEESTSALLLELVRIAGQPALAAHIMDAAVPTSDIAQAMIRDTIQQSMVRWLSYGLLAA